MGTVVIALPDDRLAKLMEKAQQLGVSPEDLVRVSIDRLLSQPDDAFQGVAEYLLKKNAALYGRLA